MTGFSQLATVEMTSCNSKIRRLILLAFRAGSEKLLPVRESFPLEACSTSRPANVSLASTQSQRVLTSTERPIAGSRDNDAANIGTRG